MSRYRFSFFLIALINCDGVLPVSAIAPVTALAIKSGTPNYLSSVFKKEMGMAVAEYIRAQKLSEVKRLLTETDYSLSEIALSLGYSSQSYFQNQFKAEFGITPIQYKTAD